MGAIGGVGGVGNRLGIGVGGGNVGGGNTIGSGNVGIGSIGGGNTIVNAPGWGGGSWGGGNWGGGNWGGGGYWGGSGGGWYGNQGWGNNYWGPGWSGACWGNWYHGGAGNFWAGFGVGALTTWGLNALYSPGYAYSSMGSYPSAWSAPVYGSWGLDSVATDWMYAGYENPYVTPATQTVVVQEPAPAAVVGEAAPAAQPVVAYDYANPINVAAPPEPTAAESAQKVFESARDSFKAGDYGRALALADQALAMLPDDPVLHEFRALCLFALKRYDEAAAVEYAVLSAGPGWDWATLVGLYPDLDAYTAHLRALEAFANQNPTAPAPRFLLAYLYLVQGNKEAAASKFSEVARLQPQDTLSAKLASALAQGSGAPAQPAPVAASAPPATPPTAPARAAAAPAVAAAPPRGPRRERSAPGPARVTGGDLDRQTRPQGLDLAGPPARGHLHLGCDPGRADPDHPGPGRLPGRRPGPRPGAGPPLDRQGGFPSRQRLVHLQAPRRAPGRRGPDLRQGGRLTLRPTAGPACALRRRGRRPGGLPVWSRHPRWNSCARARSAT